MQFHTRDEWESASQPVVGPAILTGQLDLIPAHYTAASSVPSDTASYLRAIQNDYTVNRGYSIGYNFAIDQRGDVWECRGLDIKCAANKGANDWTVAVLCLVDGAEAMNGVMVEAFTELGAYIQDATGHAELLVVGHRDIGSTACPGDGIYQQVVAGVLDPLDWTQPVPQPPDQPEEGDDMTTFIIRNRDTGQIVLLAYDGSGVTATGLAGEDLDAYTARFGAWLDTNPTVFQDFLDKSNED